MDKNQLKFQDQLYDDSMNFDDNYNEQEFLQNTSSDSNKRQKFTIMSNFNQICTKLNIAVEDSNKTQTQTANNFLAEYYTKLKQKTQKQQKVVQSPSNKQTNQCISHINPSHYRSSYQSLKQPLQQKHHQRTPSYESQLKPQIIPTPIQNKRNYYSVQDKKKTLQPTKVQQVYPTMKDYFGDDTNFVNRKVHGKMFINNIKPKVFKQKYHDNQEHKQENQTNNYHNEANKLKNQNYLKQNNLKQTNLKQTNLKQTNLKQNNLKQTNLIMKKTANSNDQRNCQKPKIIIYKKVIDLTQSTQSIIQAFRKEQMISDYEMSSLNQSIVEQGLFARAIVHQRASKTGQNVHSSNYSNSEALLKEQIMQQKQHISSPMNSNYVNSQNSAYQSIMQKRQSYLR